jgi:tryptophan synthase alpha subunit
VADGVVVGSALVERVERAGEGRAVEEAAGFLRALAAARGPAAAEQWQG